MTDMLLDPDVRHTSMDLIAGGVRLQPIKVTGDEAMAWAAKNRVDLSTGDREALINTARLARSLPPYKITTPPTPAPPALTTKDGVPSVAAAEQAYVARPGDVPMSTATEWAKANHLKYVPDLGPWIDQINEARRGFKLPPFRVKPRPNGTPYASPGQAALARQEIVDRSVSTVISTIRAEEGDEARWKGLPATAAELYDMSTSFVGTVSGLVTPALAEMILALNVENRPLSDSGVDRFVQILQSGRWINTGEPIVIATTGILNDGQHRLHAIVKAGIAALLDLRFGISREAFAATGTGMRRTNAHVLAIAGRQYSSMQGALCRYVVHYDAGQLQKLYNGIDAGEAVRMTEENPDIGRVAALLRALKFKPIKNGSFGFVLVIVARGLGFEKAEEFARLVDSGQGAEDSPTRRLNARLLDAALSKGTRLRPIDVCAMTTLAWNAWIAGRPVQVLRVHEMHRTGDGFPKILFS